MKTAFRFFGIVFLMIIVSNVFIGCSILYKDNKSKSEYTLLGKVIEINNDEVTLSLGKVVSKATSTESSFIRSGKNKKIKINDNYSITINDGSSNKKGYVSDISKGEYLIVNFNENNIIKSIEVREKI